MDTVSRSVVMPFAETPDFLARKHLAPTQPPTVFENISLDPKEHLRNQLHDALSNNLQDFQTYRGFINENQIYLCLVLKIVADKSSRNLTIYFYIHLRKVTDTFFTKWLA